MIKKWKIFGIQTNIEWYDVKTKFKQLLRKITYSGIFQEIVCLVILSYMKLVFYSCKKIFINCEKLSEVAVSKEPMIFCFWHNRLMMIPFVTQKSIKKYSNYKFMILASRHGDGKFVGRVMEKLNLMTILGSTRDKRKSSRGIDVSSFRKIFKGLKKGYSLGITPDGPRGPNQKINGELINIARLSGAGLVSSSYSCSRFKEINTWDKFKIPLPFSRLCFYADKNPIYVDKNADKEEMKKITIELEGRMNSIQEKSLEIVNNKSSFL